MWHSKKSYQLKHGVTLIDMLLYAGLLALFLGVLTSILVALLDVRTESEATSFVEEDSRFIYARLLYDIAAASVIVTPGTLGNTSASLQLTVSDVTYTYELSGNTLTLTDGSGTDQLNSFETEVSDLSFQRLGNVNGIPAVRIQYTVTSIRERPSGPESKTVTTTIGLR